MASCSGIKDWESRLGADLVFGQPIAGLVAIALQKTGLG